jgi:8-oxo-dGTP diphosphatase
MYDNPSIAVDVVLFSLINNQLNVLIRKRAEPELKNMWALPGSIVLKNETLEEKAKKTLKEKVNIKSDIYLEQLYTFDAINRDSRGRVISITYLGLVDYVSVNLDSNEKSSEISWVSVEKLPKMAFDHEIIIKKAIERLQNKIRYTNIGFSLLPKEFSIPDLRICFEAILNDKINATNFRTKLLKLKILKKLNKKEIKGKGHPAPKYELDSEKIKKLKNTITLFN